MILVLDLVYNLTMAAVDVVVLTLTLKSPSVGRCWFGAACVAVAVVVLACLPVGMFAAMRLLSYGIFIHLPLVLLVMGWTCLRAVRPNGAAWCSRATFWFSAVALAGIGIDAFFIEPRALQITTMTLVSDKVTAPLRIVLVADLQTDRISTYERRVLETAMARQPDMIMFAGDYLQVDDPVRWKSQRNKLQEILKRVGLAAPRGVYAVEGNVDARNWPEIFSDCGANIFVTTGSVSDGDVQVTGLSVRDSFNTQLRIPTSDRFHIVLGHSPDFALGDVQADLLLCGHVHGGQVRLPLLGPLLTMSRIPRSWAVGRTELPAGNTLVVSRGVGMERGAAPRMRFLCRPEIVQLDVVPARQNGDPLSILDNHQSTGRKSSLCDKEFVMLRSTTWALAGLLSFVLTGLLGCGSGKYDQQLEQRIQELKSAQSSEPSGEDEATGADQEGTDDVGGEEEPGDEGGSE